MADQAEADHSAALGEFAQVTTADVSTARRYLEENEWDLSSALRSFYYDQDEGGEESAAAPSSSRPQPSSTAASNPSGSAASSSRPPQRKTFGTLRDLGGGSNDDDDSEKEQEYFAGGDKSGLAVQDPNDSSNPATDQIRRLLETARRNGPPPPEEQQRPTHFSGQGQTLGGDDVESRVIPDPSANVARPPPMAERTLHLWDDGFSVDDGPLYRFDDPANHQILSMINSGSAPLDIMNVESGQAVDVKLATHKGENYVQPKKKYAPFGGGGQRLGSPTPGAGSSTAPPPATSSTTTTTSSSATAPKPEVDDSQPTISLQIRLADGTRLPSRFNTSHTVGDVYAFVDQASSTGGRAYSLATTFPTKELTDKAQVLGDMAEFKRGGVIVQKWT